MLILSNEGDCFVNSEYIIDVFVTDTDVIGMTTGTAKQTVRLGRYREREQALVALNMLAHALAGPSNPLVSMPTIGQVRALTASTSRSDFYVDGKRNKSHGGS